jgi:hypothetical protein
MQSSAVSARPSAAWEGRRPRAARLACRDADAARFSRAGIVRRSLVWRFSATSPAGCARFLGPGCARPAAFHRGVLHVSGMPLLAILRPLQGRLSLVRYHPSGLSLSPPLAG